jgi:hypothetical protein
VGAGERTFPLSRLAKADFYCAEFAGVEATAANVEKLIRSILEWPFRVARGNVTSDAYNAAGQGVRIVNKTGEFQTFINASDATR